MQEGSESHARMVEQLADQTLILDLEIPPGDTVGSLQLGAVQGERRFSRHLRMHQLREVLDRLHQQGPRALLGHNILGHDLPFLRQHAAGHPLLDLPVYDTLYLSPLACPQNPYHALVKDYKLTRSAKNDPEADCRQAWRLFEDCCRLLKGEEQRRPGILALYRLLFTVASADLGDGGGMARLFAAMGAGACEPQSLGPTLERFLGEKTCRPARALLARSLALGVAGRGLGAAGNALGLAHALAWIPVSGSNSVLPCWVRHQVPAAPQIIERLRGQACTDPDCAYCRRHHDPRGSLQAFFGFEDFRAEPPAPGGGSLQGAIVAHAMAGQSLLAILPTGGGKSLCFQLPALHRNFVDGSLTIVISPLQALMRDQVENLRQRTRAHAAALYGLLTPLERAEVLHGVVMGDVSVLYVAPEQLRNRSFRSAVKQRQIGAWVFDEAHCLSRWGHDFRPDYLYAGRAIREIAQDQSSPIPAIYALTATARQDVSAEILAYFQAELGKELRLFDGGVARPNLTFQVEVCGAPHKHQRVLDLCAEQLRSAGSIIVYCATRRSSEDTALRLQRAGLSAAHFHGGMEAPAKKAVLDGFVAGELRVICATNAFGMGVDKSDVRLVLHFEIPGTLENYLQEAGRAGRDQQSAACVLLFDEADIEAQFRMIKAGEISYRDMTQILRGLRTLGRRARRKVGDDFAITSGELLRDEEVDASFGDGDRDADTKVRMAVSWLEKADFVRRDLNESRVYSAKPLISDVAELERKLDGPALDLSQSRRQMWFEIYGAVLDTGPDDSLTIDELARLPAVRQWFEGLPRDDRPPQRIANRIFDELRAMTQAGLLKAGMQLSAFVTPGGPKPSHRVLESAHEVERALLTTLAEEAPDAGEPESGCMRLSLRRVAEHLRRASVETNVAQIAELLFAFRDDSRGFGPVPHLTLRPRDRDGFDLKLVGSWQDLSARTRRRQHVSQRWLDLLLGRCAKSHAASQLVEFGLEDFAGFDAGELQFERVTLEQAEAALLYLHNRGAIILQNGLAVFRAAMTLRLNPDAQGRRYTRKLDEPLRDHYQERTVQVHVMQRYAELGRDNGTTEFVHDYFGQSRERFLETHFAEVKQHVERPIARSAYARIVTDLDHPVQEAIVTAPVDENQLILAGPGSGKTRVIVHRCAYLLRVVRVPRRSLLVLCFNRSTVVELRRRLSALLDGNLQGLQIQTYDSLALRLAGRSLVDLRLEDGEQGSLDAHLRTIRNEAIGLLQAGSEGEADADVALRDQLLRGFAHILVDEYQDIDRSQYDLVSAIAGRTQADPDQRLAITAVGDDDQNIYRWRGSDNAFIRRFESDYQAKRYELVDNYRSSWAIVEAANRWIAAVPDRSKAAAIQVDRRRRQDVAGRGEPVRLITVADADHQAWVIAQRLAGLRADPGEGGLDGVAVLARGWDQLQQLRLHCRDLGLPIHWARGETIKPWQVRETGMLLRALDKAETCSGTDLQTTLDTIRGRCGESVWTGYLAQLIDLWTEDSGTQAEPSRAVRAFLWEMMKEDHRSARTSRGAFVGTVHQAKGLEFDRVFLLDGGWSPRPGETPEDLQRLFYVGMTRARRELSVLRFAGARRSFGAVIGSLQVEREDATAAVAEAAPDLGRRLEEIGHEDVDLGWASMFPSGQPVHDLIEGLRVGTLLRLVQRRRYTMLVVAEGGAPVGRLSKEARTLWLDRDVEQVRVTAVLERTKEQSETKYQDRCRVERWGVVIAEGVWRV